MDVENTEAMKVYLKRIRIGENEYQTIGDIIRIKLNHQQIWYRMNSGMEDTGYITMRNSNEYLILWNKIFYHE